MQWIFWATDLVIALWVSHHVLMNKRAPRSALLWLIWIWLLPFLGALAYLYFGLNRVGRPPHRPIPGKLKTRQGSWESLAAAVSGWPEHAGNTVDMLVDGAEGYPAMLRAIAAARSKVDLQTYLFDLDGVGELVLQALEAAARRGVRVRVLVDGLAAYSARPTLRRRLKAVGGEARPYWRWDRLLGQPLLNLRNHRKLMVVDQTVAFTGGLNISERYAKGALARLRQLRFLLQGRPSLRDLHFALMGPIVTDLQQCFDQDWKHAGGSAHSHASARRGRFRLGPGAVSGVRARVVRSGPDEDLERFYELLLGALSLARKQVDLVTPYFIPDAPVLSALRVLGYRGVKVRLHIPRASDHPFIYWAAQEYLEDLLDAGVEIYLVPPPFTHTKLVLVDEDLVFFGSSNLDPRSFRLNFELNVEAHSPSLVRQGRELMARYRLEARRLDPGTLKRRPAWKRLRSALVNLAAPYL